jgi:hypothetical protein
MATRIGEGGQPVGLPPSADNRSEQRREQMLKELQQKELVRTRGEAEHVVDQLMRRLGPTGGGLRVAPLNPDGSNVGERKRDDRPREKSESRGKERADSASKDARADTSARADARGRAEDIPRALADFQRQHGLPVSGRLDEATLQQLKDLGIVAPPADHGEPHAEKAPVNLSEQAAARKVTVAGEKVVKHRAEQHEPNAARALQQNAHNDPARLFASLVSAGFLGNKGALEDGIKSFQATFGLPLSGKLDEQTSAALEKHGLLSHQGASTQTGASAAESKAQVKRALSEAQKATVAADKNIERDSNRPQASTKQPTTSAEVAARAPSSATSEAKDHMRLDNAAAQQPASERGVQEGAGDPHAVSGQGASEGRGQGVEGRGAAAGGGIGTTGEGAIGPEAEPAGDESAVGNSKAGDADFVDESRGQASERVGPDDDDGLEQGHYQVPTLLEQVTFALSAIARDDTGSVPVTYSWDVTFYRPGVYAPGQPAEEIWRIAVTKATAFDQVWQQACDAIAAKMLYLEPDSVPLTIDDFLLALQKARYGTAEARYS